MNEKRSPRCASFFRSFSRYGVSKTIMLGVGDDAMGVVRRTSEYCGKVTWWARVVARGGGRGQQRRLP